MTARYPATRRHIVSVLAAVALAGALSSTAGDAAAQTQQVRPVLDPYQHRLQFVGHWLMSRRTKDGGESVWLIHRQATGTYRRVTRRIEPSGQITQHEDVGRWGVVNNVLFLMTRGRTRPNQSALDRADPADPYSYDAFNARSVSKQQIQLQSLHTGRLFRERRVAQGFRLPAVSQRRPN